jgi:RHS repeat-associated protein
MESYPLGNYTPGDAGSTTEYIYLPTANGPMPIAVQIGANLYAIDSDHLNTPRRLTDANGRPVWQWVTTGFGELEPTTAATGFIRARLNIGTPIANTAAVQFNLRYPGQQYDAETGLFYNHHRTYDPYLTVGYTQADPLGLDGGWNRFGFVDGNPVNWIDPDGLQMGCYFCHNPDGSLLPKPPPPPPPSPPVSPPAPPSGPTFIPIPVPPYIVPIPIPVTENCPPEKNCPPCKTVSGIIVPVGTIAYRPLDTPSRPQHGIDGPHYNIFRANQYPAPKCDCFWQPIGAVPPVNLPAGAIPIEPFVN